jgi:hypothetical protein
MSEEITNDADEIEVVKRLMYSAIKKMNMLTSGSETEPFSKTILDNFFSTNPTGGTLFGEKNDMLAYCSDQDINHEEVVKLVEEFINNMEKSDFLERRNSVKNRTITFDQQRIEAKQTYWYTLRDIVGKFTGIKRYNPIEGFGFNPSNHCKARHVFITILWIIKKIFSIENTIMLNFEYTQGFTDSSLLKSSRVCNGITNSNDLRSSDSPLCPDNCEKNLDKVYVVKGGGYKSRRTRRRKHSRKSHHKHARKTHHNRKHHSRAARKHKKYSRRR